MATPPPQSRTSLLLQLLLKNRQFLHQYLYLPLLLLFLPLLLPPHPLLLHLLLNLPLLHLDLGPLLLLQTPKNGVPPLLRNRGVSLRHQLVQLQAAALKHLPPLPRRPLVVLQIGMSP